MNIKKIASIVLTGAILLSPVMTMADTTASTSSSAQIQLMLSQIQTLQTQIQALKIAQTQVASTSATVMNTLVQMRNLRQGMSGEDVKALQSILAADPNIYSGDITGFFGKKTAEALKKYQKKNGLDGVGFVGPKTLKKLMEHINILGISSEIRNASSTEKRKENENKELCIKIPPGQLIAQGLQKKDNDRRGDDDKNERKGEMRPISSILPPCKNLPKGIEDKLGDDWKKSSTTPTLINQASASVVVGGIIKDSAILSLGNNPTGNITFQVYGPWDSTCLSPIVPVLGSVTVNGNGTYSSANFTSTTTGTYKFIASYSGDSKNKAVSTKCADAGASVVVTAVPDITAPVISAVGTSNLLATTTSITWTTNEASNSKVWFGTTSPISTSGPVNSIDLNLSTSHSVALSNLATSTTYYYIVGSVDGSGNTATSSQSSFTTLAQ